MAAFCPGAFCVGLVQAFADNPGYFAVIVQPNHGATVIAPTTDALDNTALIEVAGSRVVRAALKRSATAQTVPSGPIYLHGNPSQLAVIAAAPGRPTGSGSTSQVKPTFAAVYGITLVDDYLKTVARTVGYSVSVIADGKVLASSLPPASRPQLLEAAAKEHVGSAGPSESSVVPADGAAPSVAFVPITAAGNDNARLGTLVISQRASVALAAQRSVLRRLVLTALAVLVVVAIVAFVMAQRIADPVRRLTVAARRVSRGDLDAVVEVDSVDEVGVLARAFDDMTASLRRLTTDLRDAADEEGRLRARLETVVGSMTDGLVTTDGAGIVVAANPTALELLGCQESDVVGQPLIEAVDVRGADGEALMAARRPGDVEGSLRRTDGDEVPVRFARAPLRDQPGEVVVVSDRTRERELERLKTEFLANVSHELRTPLTPIRGYAEMLVRHPNLDGDKSKNFLTEILAGTERMSRAVELLVDVSALDAGQVVPERREAKVAAIADERIEAWRARFPSRANDFRRRVAAKLPAVEVDPTWLAKALDELADNAVKFTKPGAAITLAAALTDDGNVSIAVRDAGPGIDTERLNELLGDFSQADASETRPVGGFGLGLGFVRRVAAALGARLAVTSDPGKGAEFALIVPAVTPAPRRKTSASSRRR
jgi:PAS domain S-box-containing protein